MHKLQIRVPTRHRDVLTRFARLSDGEFEDLRNALSSEPNRKFLSRNGMERRIQRTLREWSERDASRLAISFDAMVGASGAYSDTVRAVAESVSRSDDLDLEPEERETLVNRLVPLLEIPGLQANAKAEGLAGEYDRVFHTARILTDVRPIFGSDIAEDLLGVLVMHQLRIDSHTNLGDQDYYFALTTDDLTDLRDTIDRALGKSKAIDQWLQLSGSQRYEISPSDEEG